MDMFVVEGGRPLRGTVRISGSKNACLPLMCAALLTDQPTTIENVPNLRDIRSMMDLLDHLNVRVVLKNGRMFIDPSNFDTAWVPYDTMRKMRASMYAFGPMIARLRRAAVSRPGGCNIGARPIDLHLRGFSALGAQIEERQGYIHALHHGVTGAEFDLSGPYGPSVGASCNVLMASVFAKGHTVIHNAAREPEVQELANFLNAMGAKIEGIGSNKLEVEGVEKLSATKWRVQPDRIEAATFAVAALITDGDLVLQNVTPEYMGATLKALRDWGAEVDMPDSDSLRVRRKEGCAGNPLQLRSAPYPCLPTDVQPQFVALLGLTRGFSTFEESIYPDRFMHLEELNRLGGRTLRRGSMAAIQGVERYEGAAVMASDLRAGAALTLAALAANGESQIRRVYHIDRGYERFEQKLASVGGLIRRTHEQEFDPGLTTVKETFSSESETPSDTAIADSATPRRKSSAEIETSF